MKSLPTLYSRASSGAIRHWTIQTDGAKYRTVYGQKDGKTTTSEWYPTEATNVGRANERTGPEQAIFEAEAQWKRNQELGYFQNVADVDKALKHVEVMLAAKYEKRRKYVDLKKQNWGLQLKLNGNRNCASVRGHMTRGGKQWLSVPHIVKELEPFFEKYPTAILDGELFNYDLRQSLNELSKLVRKSKPSQKDLDKSRKMVNFYIYDGYGFAGMDESTPYHIRKAWIDENVIAKFNYCKEVKTHVVRTEDEMYEKCAEFLSDGQEGGILRNLDEGYEHRRSDNLLKLKPEDDDEGKILSITEGKGNARGIAKNALIEWQGKQFDAEFMGTLEMRRQILKEKKKWIGKNVTFIFIGLTGKGVPNSARINPTNCFKNDR